MMASAGLRYATIRICMATAVMALSTTNLRAEITACTAIAASDVAPIVGSTPMQATATGCSWRASKDHFVLILDNTPRSSGMPVEAMFGAARNAASNHEKVTDESGLGDKAFLAISSSGVAALQILKKGRLLQVQMYDGSAPSNANLEMLRAIAAKAVTAF